MLDFLPSVISCMRTSFSSLFWILVPSGCKSWNHNDYSPFLTSVSNIYSSLIPWTTEIPPTLISLFSSHRIHSGIHCFLMKSLFKSIFSFCFHYQAFYYFTITATNLTNLNNWPNYLIFFLKNFNTISHTFS